MASRLKTPRLGFWLLDKWGLSVDTTASLNYSLTIDIGCDYRFIGQIG